MDPPVSQTHFAFPLPPMTPDRNDQVHNNDTSPTCSTVIRHPAGNRKQNSLRRSEEVTNTTGLGGFANSPSPFASELSGSSWNTSLFDHHNTDLASQFGTNRSLSLAAPTTSLPRVSNIETVKHNESVGLNTASKVRNFRSLHFI